MPPRAHHGHRHRWESTTLPCDFGCETHPAVRCAAPGCPLHDNPIDITKMGDPRLIEAEWAMKMSAVRAAAEITRSAWQAYQQACLRLDRLEADMRTIEGRLRSVTGVGEEAGHG